MARILLDARNITAQPGGVGRYASSLIPELLRLGSEHHFLILRHRSNPRPLFEAPNAQEIFVDLPIDDLRGFLTGHRMLSSVANQHGPPDLFHSLFHLLPRKTKEALPTTSVVTTLHDFLWLDHPDISQPTFTKARAIQAFARVALPHALRTSHNVIAISEPTRRRARDFISDDKMTLISHGVDSTFFKAPAPLSGDFATLRDRPYAIAIGNSKEYKNLRLLLDAFSLLQHRGRDLQLVLVGDCQGLHQHVASALHSESVHLTGYIDDHHLRALLGHATAFVFPSKIEGFGLPLLEAMAMGVPVLSTRREPMESIADQAALYFHPDDPTDLAHLLGRLLADQDLHAEMSRRGLERARQFSWQDTATKTLQLYRKTMVAPR